MQVDMSMVISIISIIMVIATFIMNFKKNNSNDGYFVGKVETKLDAIEKKLDALTEKYEQMPREVDERIKLRLEEHIRQYHS